MRTRSEWGDSSQCGPAGYPAPGKRLRVNCVLPGLVEDTDFIAPVVGLEDVPDFSEILRELATNRPPAA